MSEVRLIDANTLKAKIKSRYDNDDAEFDRGYNIGLKAAVELIDSAPTVTPDMAQVLAYESGKASAEIPTGHWESVGFVGMKYAWCRCSNCHKTTKIYKDSSNEFCCIADIKKKAVACLYCGARMKEAENE